VIFKTDDVVFAQVAAGLHLDDFQRYGAGVCQAVHFAQRDVCRLVFSQKQHLVAVSNFGSSLDDNPVLGAVVVLLQTEAGTGFDLDAFDLEAPAFVDAVIPAPGAVYFAMQGVFFTLSAL
jgi:hypothetical protein